MHIYVFIDRYTYTSMNCISISTRLISNLSACVAYYFEMVIRDDIIWQWEDAEDHLENPLREHIARTLRFFRSVGVRVVS